MNKNYLSTFYKIYILFIYFLLVFLKFLKKVKGRDPNFKKFKDISIIFF